jgi:hypothetical protein
MSASSISPSDDLPEAIRPDGLVWFVSARFGPLMIFLKRWFAFPSLSRDADPGPPEVDDAKKRLAGLKE